MAVSYKKLWKLLIDKEMMKKDLRAMTGVSTTTMSRLSKDENVSTEILSKICSALNCDVGDIMEFVPDKKRGAVRRYGNMDHSYPYIASLTREPFLFYEMRSTAKLMVEGISNDAIVKEIVEQNLFQYPTEKSITRMAKACIKRLHALEDDSLVSAIASQPTDVAKQICLYALMKQSRLVWEFMLTVIGEKYRLRDTSFGKIDLNTFFMRLQEQNDTVASWSDSTITKLKQIIARVLVETEYLDNLKADHLNPVWLHPVLENAIRSNGDMTILPAFNCFV